MKPMKNEAVANGRFLFSKERAETSRRPSRGRIRPSFGHRNAILTNSRQDSRTRDPPPVQRGVRGV